MSVRRTCNRAGFSVEKPFHVGKYADIQSAALVATHQKIPSKTVDCRFSAPGLRSGDRRLAKPDWKTLFIDPAV
jgi:hypothetical protein